MSGLLPLYAADEMRALDARAMEDLGIPGVVLMERAGLAAAHELLQRHPQAARVAIVCGPGNNGGDGFVVARHLHAAGLDVTAMTLAPLSRLGIDARTNHDLAERLGVTVLRNPAPARLRSVLRRADVAVDAVFGIGFEGAPRGAAAAAVAHLNRIGAPVVALDVPSGVNASDGTVAGVAVQASLTVAFHGPKLGLTVSPGRLHAGAVVVADIGIPPQLERPTQAMLATRELLDAVPRRDASSTKYSAGSVLVVGGAAGYAGAPLLAGRAALRAGAGAVWLAVPEATAGTIGAVVPELMVRALPGALAESRRAGAIVVGPGLGRERESLALARRLAVEHPGRLLVDADGLFALNGRLEELATRREPVVLTPHEGELARLLELEARWIRANRLQAVCEAARRSNAVVLLKGADTLIAAPGGERVVVSVAEAHGLATAGSGDVLAGTIGALLASGLDPLTAAACGAVAHARAGVAATAERGPDGIIAGDVIEQLPAVFAGR